VEWISEDIMKKDNTKMMPNGARRSAESGFRDGSSEREREREKEGEEEREYFCINLGTPPPDRRPPPCDAHSPAGASEHTLHIIYYI